MKSLPADADYQGNLVVACGDDAIETDTVSGINLRLWYNNFDGNYSGLVASTDKHFASRAYGMERTHYSG